MASFKLFAVLVMASTLCNQLTFAAEADWEVINMALDNINAANPTVLKNSVLNIIEGFLPNLDSPKPATAGSPAATATNPSTAQQQPPVIVVNQPPAQPAPAQPAPAQPAPTPAPSQSWQQFLMSNPQLLQILLRPVPSPAQPIVVQPQPAVVHPQPAVPTIAQIISHSSDEKCECKKCKKPSSLAEFLVNVPCRQSTTTEKPPKKIIVKVPCPTTTTTTEKPCQCQCCPCNPCPQPAPPKKHQRVVESASSEEYSHETVYKTYKHPRPHYKHESEECSREHNTNWAAIKAKKFDKFSHKFHF